MFCVKYIPVYNQNCDNPVESVSSVGDIVLVFVFVFVLVSSFYLSPFISQFVKKVPICLYLSKKNTYFVPVLPIVRVDKHIINH